MSVLTESEVRRQLKGKDFKEYTEFRVIKGQIVTPSAKSFLSENNIHLKYVDSLEEVVHEVKKAKEEVPVKLQTIEEKNKYITVFGAELMEKPEHMTHLHGNLLVFKDHKVIALRGKLDSLESKILETQVITHKLGASKLTEDLEEILKFVRGLLRCEVVNEPVGEFKLLGMTPEELREKSHYPKKYYGIGHEPVAFSMGEAVVALNSCRTTIRETELLAYTAFKGEYGDVQRPDIIKALNRLSSLFWIMIFKYRTGEYS
ncbi:cobalamin adenosyltransferase [Clostridium sp. UBA5988]|uniref:cobalamin adenosyltransferase n=1 Tax=Clostridium sp. UBA5988 TaxID=1946369 RepID=UPI001243467D